MLQVLQNLKNGETSLVEVPAPGVKSGHLLIGSRVTLVSSGTERMLVEFGKANLLDKALQQPDKVRMVIDKIKTDGMLPTVEAVFNKLDQPLPLGYCNVGCIVEVGAGVNGFHVGDRVISNGKHAEFVNVPVNLCAKVPDSVSDEEASFAVLGAIALQGIRLLKPTLGEAIVVTGLGLVGLLTIQLLRAHGCRVMGLDFDKNKLELAKQFGAEVVDLGAGQDPVKAAEIYSRGRGVDGVIVTASTKSSEPMHQAALMCRKRGRIILVGVAGLELSRDDFFKKELTFQVSASYGPGRYDSNYEEKGQDYPVGFVRWTEQRNFEAVLDMMADGRLNVSSLITHRFALEDAIKAYDLVGGTAPSLGILLHYKGHNIGPNSRTVNLMPLTNSALPKEGYQKSGISFVGSGNYASSVLIPAFRETGADLRIVASNSGVSGSHVGRKYGFIKTTTDTNTIFQDDQTNGVVITTQHDSHAHFVLTALEAGKNIFVEKPLCINLEELKAIESAFNAAALQNSKAPIVMVGFNRRFAPQIQKIKELLSGVTGPKAFIMTINAGSIPPDHWTQDRESGGGRIVGEACHFIDLIRYLAASPIVSWNFMGMESTTRDTVTIQLCFEDGSIGTVHYFSNGCKAFPKERLEVFASGRVLQLDNFRKLKGFNWPGFKKMNLWRQNKGQKTCAKAFVSAIEGCDVSPIPFSELLEVSRVSIELANINTY